MIRDPYRYFRIEARDLIARLNQGVLALERSAPAKDAVLGLLRLAHTLKGAARVVKEIEIAEMAHGLEDALARHRELRAPLSHDEATALLAMVDAIAARVAALPPAPVDGEGTPAQGAPAAARRSDEELGLLGADISGVDSLLGSITEASARTAGLRRSLEAAERAGHLATLLLQQLDARRADAAAAGDVRVKARGTAQELRAAVEQIAHSLRADVDQLDRELAGMRESAERLQLVPVKAVMGRLERVARDAALAAQREIRFSAQGGEVRLDARVLGVILPALVQLVRNAVAHGIEPASERRRAGKAAEGTVALEVTRLGRTARFVCRDDGQGIDLDAVARIAQRRGLLPQDATAPDAAQLIRLLLHGGISTAADVTEVAGRGVGLDVVREAVERLGGSIEVHTERLRGTSVEILVPVSMASVDALVVESAGITTAVPLEAIRRVVRHRESDVLRSATEDAVANDGQVLPLVPLSQALGFDAPAQDLRAVTAVIVQCPAGTASLAVDRIVGERHIVVRPLPELAPAFPFVAGAWLDSRGNAQLVLDPDELVAAARNMPRVAPQPAPKAPPLLVIDDSLTTRMLEQSILESAGFEVDLAASGEQGLEMARARRYGAFLVDVEMPGMDGYAFIEHVRADPALQEIPVILVTSRGAAEERQRGLSAGAAAYIVKSEFDQEQLLATIRRFIGLT